MASAIRLMPSLNKIIMSINNLKYYETSISKLFDHEKKLRNYLGQIFIESPNTFDSIIILPETLLILRDS